jgi:CRP/FNR family cyclic AMP-dependent transcriptional regulator
MDSCELHAAIAEIEFNSFADLRQRVARQVPNLAVPQGNDLVARVTQQQLADAVGSVREAVARVLRELRWAESWRAAAVR